MRRLQSLGLKFRDRRTREHHLTRCILAGHIVRLLSVFVITTKQRWQRNSKLNNRLSRTTVRWLTGSTNVHIECAFTMLQNDLFVFMVVNESDLPMHNDEFVCSARRTYRIDRRRPCDEPKSIPRFAAKEFFYPKNLYRRFECVAAADHDKVPVAGLSRGVAGKYFLIVTTMNSWSLHAVELDASGTWAFKTTVFFHSFKDGKKVWLHRSSMNYNKGELGQGQSMK